MIDFLEQRVSLVVMLPKSSYSYNAVPVRKSDSTQNEFHEHWKLKGQCHCQWYQRESILGTLCDILFYNSSRSLLERFILGIKIT